MAKKVLFLTHIQHNKVDDPCVLVGVLTMTYQTSDLPPTPETKKSKDTEVEVMKSVLSDTRKVSMRRARVIAPFVPSHDVRRGILYALQALLTYTLMLAVM